MDLARQGRIPIEKALLHENSRTIVHFSATRTSVKAVMTIIDRSRPEKREMAPASALALLYARQLFVLHSASWFRLICLKRYYTGLRFWVCRFYCTGTRGRICQLHRLALLVLRLPFLLFVDLMRRPARFTTKAGVDRTFICF